MDELNQDAGPQEEDQGRGSINRRIYIYVLVRACSSVASRLSLKLGALEVCDTMSQTRRGPLCPMVRGSVMEADSMQGELVRGCGVVEAGWGGRGAR